jgi:hypothetical protein
VRVGDRLVAIDGVVPRDLTDVRYETQGRDWVTVDLLRDGELLTFPWTWRTSSTPALTSSSRPSTASASATTTASSASSAACRRACGARSTCATTTTATRSCSAASSRLTNLEQDDWHRIAYQRLSPLRSPVHATDPDVRARSSPIPGAAPILPQLEWLGRPGLQIHAQVVLCPGINDGPVLERTISEPRQPGRRGRVGGRRAGRDQRAPPRRDIRPATPDDAGAALDAILGWNKGFRASLGRGFVYPSDELF